MTHEHDHDHVHETGRLRERFDDELEPRLTPDQPRTLSDADRVRFEGYLAEIFTALGLDLDTPGTASTPSR
ncbi:MAG: hypothetical protein ACHQ7M_20555, partial [Chloroflexota bacterium]